jgi:hypothetical protein
MTSTKIVYWNMGKKPGIYHEMLYDPKKYDIAAITEPPRNKGKPGARCPRSSQYRIVQWLGPAVTRAIILIGPNVKITDSEAHPDWCRVTIDTRSEGEVDVYAIYSPGPGSLSRRWWPTPITDLAQRQPTKKSLLLGDFNLWHPSWSTGRTRHHAGAQRLIDLAAQWRLTLLTPRGTPTYYNPRGCDTTIDLAWASTGLPVEYRPTPELQGSDHVPQEVWIKTAPTKINRLAGTPNWKLTDRPAVLEEAKSLPLAGDLASPKGIDDYVDILTKAIEKIAEVTTPKRKGNPPRNKWWSTEIKLLRDEAMARTADWRAVRTPRAKQEMREAEKAKKTAIFRAQREAWRRDLQEAAEQRNPKMMWNVSKWARLSSHKPPEPAILPALRHGPDHELVARSYDEKVEVLRQRFYPEATADLSDIHDTSFSPESFTFTEIPEIANSLPPLAEVDEIAARLGKAAPWRASGLDGIPNGFLKALGPPFIDRLTTLLNASWAIGYYPRSFRAARTVVIPKDKAEKDVAGAWRPIALLRTMGKVMETVMAKRIADAAESGRLLPEEQMGNRRNRSCEAALRLIVDQTHAAWDAGGTTSLLALDVSGAFDRVDHTRLLDVMRRKGFPHWVVKWVRSFLTDRSTTLLLDNQESQSFPIRAGVPQGSPLSPILFVLYSSALYDDLRSYPGVTAGGFADDTTILAYGRTTEECSSRLKEAHKACEEWATKYGMTFDIKKYQLVHFTRTRQAAIRNLDIGGVTLTSGPSAKVLGVSLDWKLSGSHHFKYLKEKMETQRLSVEKTMASTWGPSLRRSRVVYTAVIRAALGYGSPLWHKITDARKRPQGRVYKDLSDLQRDCAIAVSGAYLATRTAILETELHLPPIDLWLNSRVSSFHRHFRESGLAIQSSRACNRVTQAITHPRGAGLAPSTVLLPTKHQLEAIKAHDWNGEDKEKALLREWKTRWDLEAVSRRGLHHRSYHPTADRPPDEKNLQLHDNLQKGESALLIQLRTECIGLNSFLASKRVPDVPDATCACGRAEETVTHILAHCQTWKSRGETLLQRIGHDDKATSLSGTYARETTKWFMRTTRLNQFRLALRLIDKWESEDREWERLEQARSEEGTNAAIVN